MELISKAGEPSTISSGLPGVQGPAIMGTQGMGVSTPRLAADAEATLGLAIEVHIPKGGIFAIEAVSVMFAI